MREFGLLIPLAPTLHKYSHKMSNIPFPGKLARSSQSLPVIRHSPASSSPSCHPSSPCPSHFNQPPQPLPDMTLDPSPLGRCPTSSGHHGNPGRLPDNQTHEGGERSETMAVLRKGSQNSAQNTCHEQAEKNRINSVLATLHVHLCTCCLT